MHSVVLNLALVWEWGLLRGPKFQTIVKNCSILAVSTSLGDGMHAEFPLISEGGRCSYPAGFMSTCRCLHF